MNPLWFLPAVSSLFGAVSEYNASKDIKALAAEQELMAEENAVLEQRELDENLRRQRIQDAQVRGTALARAAASGRRIEGTLSDYLTTINNEQTRELDWAKTAGASRIRLNLQAARNQARATRLKAKAKKRAAFSGVLNAASILGAGGLFSTSSLGELSGGGVGGSIGIGIK